jgi:plasmid stability protein
VSQLIVRNLDDALVRALKRRAARHSRSAEAEHRAILHEVLSPEIEHPCFEEILADMPDLSEDEDFSAPRDPPREIAR